MIKIFEKLLDLIYIKYCYFCKSTKDDSLLCSKCYKKIRFMPYGVLRKEEGCNIYACTIYDGIVKDLIKALKYKRKKNLSAVMSRLMYEYWQNVKTDDKFLILPVPIHKTRLKERKYNHMDLTADSFSELTKYISDKKFLIRIKDTKKQYNLHKKEREKNLKDAFIINKNRKIDKNTPLLIIDDITSTGATFNEIIKLLKKEGYKNITALALATPDIWN